eukprot:CAMPEP_0172188552 /NCGR_PEP_ID=MMETSP1050-20130122/21999_1 /TAXON_ID=233186 /ORGANISM="Cryptomonas curvata, Strain CCAP979/52" /LENGTH=515 /DNA_ID=CAMNT_0012863083 /DNA_START=572 /DNA_END=2119 /DNA_ORIENTATION=+
MPITNPFYSCKNPDVGNFFEVDQLQHTGLNEVKQKRLFASTEVVRLFQALDDFIPSSRRGLAIGGSPGLGKSCTTWAWACKKGLLDGSQVLWVHVAKYFLASCVLFSGKSCTTCSLGHEALVQMLNQSSANIIVFDGYGFKMGDRISEVLTTLMVQVMRCNSKVIFVSSLGGNLKASELGLGRNDLTRFEMSPWTLEDYIAACADVDFFKSVRKFFAIESTADTISADLLQEKYFYAGVSVRWMFEMDIDAIKAEIEMHFSEVRNPEALVDLSAASSTLDSSNHLLMRTRRSDGVFISFFVSKYAMQHSIQKFHKKGIAWAYHLSAENRNRSHFGWVLELDFVTKLRAAAEDSMQLTVQDLSNAVVPWKVSGVENFDGSAQTLKRWELDHWMIPKSSRQPGFDAACLTQVGMIHILRVVQVTCGSKHNLRMDTFASLIQKLVSTGLIITGLEVIFLLPKFADRDRIAPPILELSGPGQCKQLKVGASDENWDQGQEEKHVLFHGLEAPVHFFTAL